MKMKHSLKHLSLPALCGLAGWALTCPLSGLAATANVSIGDDFFSPTSTTINVNDRVIWTWNGSGFIPHTTTSDTLLWDSSPAKTSGTFTNTFGSAGSFPYHCAVHPLTMKASITVQAVNVPPTVAITNPPDGKVLSAPATIIVAASASSSAGSVTNVQFFQGTTSLGNVTSSPYSVVVNNLGAGDYTFSAVATDNGGLSATNAIVVHVVTPVAIVLSSPQQVSPNAFQFSYSANPGLSYVVLRSGALPSFSPISTNTATGSTENFLDNSATGAVNFYRVGLMPNP